MSKYANYRAASRAEWAPHGTTASDRDVEVGCLQRIADATEAMAKNYVELQRDVDRYQRWYAEEREKYRHAQRRIAGLKGYIKRMKGER